MKKVWVPLVVVVLLVCGGVYGFFHVMQAKDEPILETFRVDAPVSGKQKSREFVDTLIGFYATVEEGKNRLGYVSSYRMPFTGKAIHIGNDRSGDGFHYLSSMNFYVSPGMVNVKPSTNDIRYFSLGRSDVNLSIYWPGYRRELVYLWGVNTSFKSTVKAGSLEKTGGFPRVDAQSEMELSPKEYAYIGNSENVETLWFQSDFPFKLKFSDCPDQYYTVNPSGERGAVFKFDNAERKKKGAPCSGRQSGQSSPEGIYMYDPPDFATQGITVKIGLNLK